VRGGLKPYVRLQPGVTLAQAQGEISRLRSDWNDYPETNRGRASSCGRYGKRHSITQAPASDVRNHAWVVVFCPAHWLAQRPAIFCWSGVTRAAPLK